MSEIIKKEDCTWCEGKGYRWTRDYMGDGVYGDEYTEKCSDCNGTGKKTATYIEEGRCPECDGEGKTTYYKENQFLSERPPFGGFRSKEDEERWMKRNTIYKTCNRCGGRKTDLKYVSSKPGNTSGCFVATAVYGSYSSPQVLILRRFRDESLQHHFLGERFIKFYYKYSPGVAHSLKYSRLALKCAKIVLDIFVYFLSSYHGR